MVISEMYVIKDDLYNESMFTNLYNDLDWFDSPNVGTAFMDNNKTISKRQIALLTPDHSFITNITFKTLLNAAKELGIKTSGPKCSIKIQKYVQGDKFDWHCDDYVDPTTSQSAGHGYMKVLTMDVPLNDNFTGGVFKLKTDNDNILEHQKMYSALIFPSTMYHAVEPITSGVRYVLTAWLYDRCFEE